MPKELPIITHPDPRLRLKSAPVDEIKINSAELQSLLLDMKETMLKKAGAGLAAPQIDHPIRVIVIHHEDKTIFLINPEITGHSWARKIEEEGCLSVLNEQGEIIYAPVERYKKVTGVYLDERGQKQKIRAEKILARILQHEIDHLDGILFIDKLAQKKKTS